MKKLITKVAISSMLFTCGFISVAQAAGIEGESGVVHFTGEISEASCNVTAATSGATVNLGIWSSSYFKTSDETPKTKFNIDVDGCPATVKNVAVQFDGSADGSDNYLLAVTGGATGVGVGMYESDQSTRIKLGKTTDKVAPTAEGTAQLTFYASYKKDGESIGAGLANSDANFVMIYN